VHKKSFAASFLLFLSSTTLAAEPLPGHGADAATFTVSGVSSGGYMAVQIHVAHSSRVKGAAALAAGPYYCAQGSLWTATQGCMSPGWFTPLPDLQVLKAHAERFEREKRIDPLANLAQGRVWLFSGTQDRTVTPAVVGALNGFYVHYKVSPLVVRDKPAGHAMVTEEAGAACGATEPPFINDCDYDAAGALLRHLLGALSGASKPEGRLLAFDQNDFANAHSISMGATGYAYIPRACETERCRVHVAFHGCRQSAEAVGERFVREAGYNRWADTNRLIVLYPQAIARYWWVYNPRGCWDWWGYTGSGYATKDGAQIRAVLGMVDRLGQARK
jgi:poly(3-hydroxybutyrate) depolymerase